MPHIDQHKPGAFCWIELATTDQNAAKSFYSSLFGWTVNDVPMGPNDFYSMFQLNGRDSGAAYTMREQERSAGVPPHWNLYIATGNADATAARAAQLGGKVLAPAFDVSDVGRMAVVQDPTDAVFCVWQAKSHAGVRIHNENGALCWADLMTRDPERARSFYGDLFGWQIVTGEHDTSGYLHIKNGEDFIGGIPPAGNRDPHIPPHWLIYFLVADPDATAEQARQLGGSVRMPPMSLENVGRFAVLADPQQAGFAIFRSERRG